MTKILLSTSLLLIALSAAANDESSEKLSVFLFQQCEQDSVGQRIAFKIREGLNSSTSMTAVDRYESSVIQVSLVCLTPEIENRGNFSNYSYQVTLMNPKGHYDYALTHAVGTCGSLRVAECAEGIVAGVDKAVSDLRSRVQNGSFDLPI